MLIRNKLHAENIVNLVATTYLVEQTWLWQDISYLGVWT